MFLDSRMKKPLAFLLLPLLLLSLPACNQSAQTESPIPTSTALPSTQNTVETEKKTMGEPAIITYQMHHDEFQFLGKEYSKLNADYGKIWDDFINAGGYEMNKQYGKYSYDCMVVNHYRSLKGSYCPGVIVEGMEEAPDGFELMQFPVREYIVVTHEWVPTKDQALYQIGRIDQAADNLQAPAGYELYPRRDNEIVKIEVENMNTEEGSRWENWVPIRKIVEAT